MGMIDRFGRIADTYISERDQLLEADDERRRVFVGHAFWPTEIIRDSIILAAMMAVISFYSWIIPPPLHSAADPFAQAGFVFPDWYVLFSYGYLRWGEYLPQFIIPAGPIGDFFGSPVIAWNAGWWGSALTGIPVGLLALPPFIIGKREKRGVEDPWFATAGAVYLAHVWFISVFSINIFLDLYSKDLSNYCWSDSHNYLFCGRQAPWTADVFNAIPWVLTGIFVFAVLYFGVRWFVLNSIGARLSPIIGRQIAIGTIVATVIISVVTWPIYDSGFWDYGGLGAMDELEDLDGLRAQPSDTLVHQDKGNVWTEWEDDCLPYSETQSLAVWDGFDFEHDDPSDWCVIAAANWADWGIYQPTKKAIIDFAGDNGHADAEIGRNSGGSITTYSGNADESSIAITDSSTFEVENLGVPSVPADVSCTFRTVYTDTGDSARNAGIHSQSIKLLDSSGSILWENEGGLCESTTIYLSTGSSYTVSFSFNSEGVNESISMATDFSAVAHQPLLLSDDGTAMVRSESSLSLDELTALSFDNPTYHKNPKGLDAKLIYSLSIPCLGVGAIVFLVMRSMARGYEWEMNKCYGCDLCDDACPVRLFNAGDKLNIIYNTWNNEDDGVPLYSCLTCTACTNACPQLVDYDSYIDIRRNLIVGGPPATEIPHTLLQAVLAAEAEEDADEAFVSIEDYPIDSNVGYYPGCVDYIDQEMVFSHVNEGEMNLGETTTAAFTLFEEMGEDVTYLGRDFLKCCGHDQKWQGLSEVFEKLKAYNQKKLGESGIDTLVTSCAECFRTFALDYELDGMKVMHTTEYLVEKGFDMDLSVDEDVTVTYHDPCRLGRQMDLYDKPRDLVESVEGVSLVEMEHHGEDALCCGVSSMMACNENSRALRLQRFDEVKATGAEVMLTTCPKCVAHFECLKFEGDPRHDFEILDVVSFLARQVNSRE
uniref:Cysteine-rich domain protein n=1 Tax=uncultured marine group II/III euryarchaeote SAT1000_18_C09 TaxID=1456564 RepID=A0A075IC78_9EURY|nr:cysteine-rich domain protein [uncultured marine group II/III euryarchaeote SAT1000_18_C09]